MIGENSSRSPSSEKQSKMHSVAHGRILLRAGRCLFRFAFGLVILFGLLLAFLFVVLFTDFGTRIFIEHSLSFYNKIIPARIHISYISGNLFNDFSLAGIQIDDADGDPLVSAGKLQLRWQPMLFSGAQLVLDDIRIDDAIVHIRQKERGSTFADLVPTSDDAPGKVPEFEELSDDDLSHAGPALPFAMYVGRLVLSGVQLIIHSEESETILLENAAIDASLNWSARNAGVDVRSASAILPSAGIDVENISLSLLWNDPIGRLDFLSMQCNYGQIQINAANIDALSLNWKAEIKAVFTREALTRFSEVDFVERVQLSSKLSGNFNEIQGEFDVQAGKASVSVEGLLIFSPAIASDLNVHIRNLDPSHYFLMPAGSFDVAGVLRTSGDSLESLVAEADFSCIECRLAKYGKLGLSLQMRLIRQNLWGQFSLALAGVNVWANVNAPSMETIDALIRANVDDLANAGSLIGVNLPAGAMSLLGRCKGSFADPSCSGNIGIGELSYVEKQISVGKASLNFNIRNPIAALRFESIFEASLIRVGNFELEHLSIDASGDQKKIAFQLGMFSDDDNRGILNAELFIRPLIAMRIKQGEGRVAGTDLELKSPVGLMYKQDTFGIDGLKLSIDGATIELDGEYRIHRGGDVFAKVDNFDVAMINRFIDNPKLQGLVNLTSQLGGTSDNPDVKLSASLASVKVNEVFQGDFKLWAELSEGRVIATADWLKDGEQKLYLSIDAPLRIDLDSVLINYDSNAVHSAEWDLKLLTDSDLRAFLTLPAELRLTMSNSGKFKGTLTNPEITTRGNGSVGFGIMPDFAFDMLAEILHSSQSISLRLDEFGAEVGHFESRLALDIPTMIDDYSVIKDATHESSLSIRNFNMAILGFLLPDAVDDLRGKLNIDLKFSGLLTKPQIFGHIKVEEGQFALVDIYQRFRDIRVSLSLDGYEIKLDELSSKTGGGSIRANGAVAISPETFSVGGNAEISFERFPLDVPGVPPSMLDSKLSFSLNGDGKLVDIKAALKDTSIKVRSIKVKNPKDIPVNDSIFFVSPDFAGEKKFIHEKTILPDLKFSLEISSPLIISGPQLDMTWTGGVHADIRDAALSITGGFDLSRGQFDFLGNIFHIEQAKLAFPPGVQNEPFINLRANTDTPDARVTIILRGPLGRPEMDLSSEPAMPDYQIFTLLVTGTTETDRDSQSEVQGKAANLGTGFIALQYPELQQQLSERVGIDRVSLSFGETTGQPIITIGKRINRRIMVKTLYHHNAPKNVNRAELNLGFMLTFKWDLETFYGDANVGGIDVFWHKSFGNESSDKPNQ